LKHSTIVGKGFQKTLKDSRTHINSSAPTFIIINDSKEKQVETRAIEKVKWAQQPLEVE
jgi:hypothetical protein